MSRRRYQQACSVATALDHVGERWSLLIVRELLLGPLRFSDLARAVGGPPTDVLTRRLRDLEDDGIVRRMALGAGTGYGLTPLGEELRGPIMELGRWGLNFYRLEDLPGLVTASLANALRIILGPPEEGGPVTVQLHSEGHATWLRLSAGSLVAGRGRAPEPDLTLSGTPPSVIAAIVLGSEADDGVEIEGDRDLIAWLRTLVVLPDRLWAEIKERTAATPA